jgi:hypothetical protein
MREVDDALREDQLVNVVQRYGRWIALVLAAGLIGLAGWLWHGERRSAEAGKAGEKFVIALDQVEAGRLAQASSALTPLATDGDAGPRAAARLMQAGIALEQGRRADAARLFHAVSRDAEAPGPYREIAKIRDVATRFDTLSPEEVIDRLKPLATPGNPWFGSAGELVGAAYLKQGRGDLAGPLFAAIAKDTTTPKSLRSRAQQLAGLLGVDAVTDVAQAAEAPPASGQQP